MQWLKNILTEPNNSTLCPIRVGSGMVGALYHIAAGVGIFNGALHLDIATLGQYMQHMIELVGVGGVVVGAKSAMKGDAQ